YMMGGGNRIFTGFNATTNTYVQNPPLDQTQLLRTSTNPISYKMISPDGSVKIFSQSDGGTGLTRNVFLTKLIDPFGNAVTLNYDANLRVTSITDALNQITTVSYQLPTDPPPHNDIYKIKQVTDPFGSVGARRSATFGYDDTNRLISITDVMNNTSTFGYDAP